MVQPRPKPHRPPRLKRPRRAYVRAMRRVGFVRAAIAQIAQIRRDHPGQERDAVLWLPAWVRQMALDGTEPPEPELWSYYWRGLSPARARQVKREALSRVRRLATPPAPAPGRS